MKSCLWATRLAAAAVVALNALWASPALAWGNDGHKVIGLIARHIIDKDPILAAKVDALLAGPDSPAVGSDFATRATWADRYRDLHYDETHNWHFIDQRIGDPDPVRDCFNNPVLPAGTLASAGTPDDCVVGKINQFRQELADTHLSTAERKLALLFLMHFVGDLHQPLHGAERNGDAGGNLVYVVWGHNTNGTTLHGYWDGNVVSRLGTSPDAIAAVLSAELDQSTPNSWVTPKSDARTVAWATGSYDIANTYAYGKLSSTTRTCTIKTKQGPKPKACIVLDENTYAKPATGQARQQLKKAGVRLAAIIREALS